jgi:hypothetical protein
LRGCGICREHHDAGERQQSRGLKSVHLGLPPLNAAFSARLRWA